MAFFSFLEGFCGTYTWSSAFFIHGDLLAHPRGPNLMGPVGVRRRALVLFQDGHVYTFEGALTEPVVPKPMSDTGSGSSPYLVLPFESCLVIA